MQLQYFEQIRIQLMIFPYQGHCGCKFHCKMFYSPKSGVVLGKITVYNQWSCSWNFKPRSAQAHI